MYIYFFIFYLQTDQNTALARSGRHTSDKWCALLWCVAFRVFPLQGWTSGEWVGSRVRCIGHRHHRGNNGRHTRHAGHGHSRASGHGAGAAAVHGHLLWRTECGHTARPVAKRQEPAAERTGARQATADGHGHSHRQRAGQRHRQPVATDCRVATTVGRQLHCRHAPQPRRGRRWPVRSGEWRFDL